MRALIAGICLAVAAPAAAQSTSVGVNVAWDVARYTRVESDDIFALVPTAESIDGDALGFAANVRQAIGDDWGVAFEFIRTGEMESRSTRQFGPVPLPTGPAGITVPGVALPPFGRPDFEIEFRTEQQHMSYNALAWARHDVGDRLDLSYLGGVAFVRSEFERDFGIDPRVLAITIPASELTTVEFNVAPAAGVDADIELTDHTAFTAGLRVLGLNAGGRKGWLIRPGVGVRWTF